MEHFSDTYVFNQQTYSVISEICEPLQKFFGFNLVTYRRFYLDGKLLYIFNNKKWMDFVLNEELWITSKFKEQIRKINSDASIFSLWDEKYLDTDVVYQGLHTHNIWNGLSVYKKFDTYVETFAFAGDKSSSELLNFYVNHPEVIEHFILYFREKFNAFLKKIDPKILIPFSIQHLIETPVLNEKIDDFFKETPINRFQIEEKLGISYREMQCLIWAIKGKTSKEIARLLKLSHRSVEKYLDNIKTKMDCLSRGQMVDQIFQSETFKHLLFSKIIK